MNKQEYQAYQDSVERGLEGLTFSGVGPAVGCCDVCRDEYGPDQESAYERAEPWFSWSSCDVCGSSLGGNREPAHAFDGPDPQTANVIHLEICEDCVYYLTYGQLDDMTMMEMEN